MSVHPREVVCGTHGDIRHAAPEFAAVRDGTWHLQVSLIRWYGKYLTDATATGPAPARERRAIIPRDIALAVDLRSPAAKHHVIAGRVIDVDLPVPARPVQIGRAVIAGGGADCHPQRSGSGEDLVISVDRLLIAGGL